MPGSWFTSLLKQLACRQLPPSSTSALLAPPLEFRSVMRHQARIRSPASFEEKIVYEVKDKEMSATSAAYVRARNADPMCSFGDFVAISHEVDMARGLRDLYLTSDTKATAMILKIEVSDGIIVGPFFSVRETR